jgi:hypothetical protein
MNQYWAYGLGIHSALLLPELVAVAKVHVDVVIRLGKVEHPRSDRCSAGSCFHPSDREAFFFWEGIGSFLVKDGVEITMEPSSGIDERLIRLPLLGTILAVLLHQRGLMVLHGSAVAIGGEVVAFVGPKGRGKSTTAAMLYGRGHRLMADDILAVSICDGHEPEVIPGFPQFRLWPEAAACLLGKESEFLPHLVSGYDKRSRRLGDDFSQTPVRLGGICALEEGPTMRLTPLAPQDALIQLIANTYVARFGRQLLTGDNARSHLRHCTNLAGQVPVYRLERPNSLAVLAATAQMVEEHMRSDSCAAVG